MDNMKKMYETMMNQNSSHMAKMMDMCKSMFENSSDGESGCPSDCCCNQEEKSNADVVSNEIKPLFDEWVNQIKEEVEVFKNENPEVTLKDLANHFKLSEKSMSYFTDSRITREECSSDYESIKIKKTKNSCSLCEDYVHENEAKPIVVMSCEGACLRGEIARRAANILCHSVIPDKTVRLCLGSALTKQGGQRCLVKNAQKLVALEGCPVECGSRMISGISDEIRPKVIRTDSLADFDKSLFGINELSEEKINKLSYDVALQIAEKLK